MSQHLFQTQLNGQAVEVLMGWDRPLQGFFLVIEQVEAPSDPEASQIVYTNLEDLELLPWMGLPPKLDHFLAKLKQLGIAVPDRMIEEVRADAWHNVGNRYVTYDASGQMTN